MPNHSKDDVTFISSFSDQCVKIILKFVYWLKSHGYDVKDCQIDDAIDTVIDQPWMYLVCLDALIGQFTSPYEITFRIDGDSFSITNPKTNLRS